MDAIRGNNQMKQQNYIKGQWLDGSGSLLTSVSPIDGSSLWQGKMSNREDVHAAIEAARSAFMSWAKLPRQQRSEICKEFQRLLRENSEELADLIHRESGKPLWESRTEVGSMIGKIDLSLDAIRERAGDKQNQIAAGTAQLTHRPHGVVAIFGPYNFPGHLPNGHIVPALLAGNTLVFKPSEQCPAVGEFMVQLWQQAGIPTGVINLIQGARDTGTLLAAEPDIDGLFFTGSSVTGESLHRQFAGKPGKILALEMGGNNPLVVHKISDMRAAVYNTIQSAFVSAGQRCTCARRLIVVDDREGKKFLESLCEATEKLLVSATDENAFIGPVISESAATALLAAQDGLQAMGGTALVAMKQDAKVPALVSPGIIDVTDVASLRDTEYFGPLLQVIRVSSFEKAIEVANKTQFGLASGLFSQDSELWQQFYLSSRAGVVNWNKPLTGASGAAPFGGIGASGNHRPSAWYAADYCAYPVASLVSETLETPDTLAPGVSL